jgi:hypothetical protein
LCYIKVLLCYDFEEGACISMWVPQMKMCVFRIQFYFVDIVHWKFKSDSGFVLQVLGFTTEIIKFFF